MEVTDSGMVIWERLEHSENADFPMEVTESGMVIWERLSHPENADPSMEVTEFGMQYEVWVEQ